MLAAAVASFLTGLIMLAIVAARVPRGAAFAMTGASCLGRVLRLRAGDRRQRASWSPSSRSPRASPR